MADQQSYNKTPPGRGNEQRTGVNTDASGFSASLLFVLTFSLEETLAVEPPVAAAVAPLAVPAEPACPLVVATAVVDTHKIGLIRIK